MGRHAPHQRRFISRARRRRRRLRGAPARAGGRHAAANSNHPRHPQILLADIRTHLRRYRGPARAGAGGGGGRGARRAGRADSGAGARKGGAARAGHAAGAALGPREWRDGADGPRGRAVRAAARARHRLRAHAGNPASRLRLDYGLHRRSVAAGAGAAAHAVCGGGGGALSRLAGGAHAAGRCLAHGVTEQRGQMVAPPGNASYYNSYTRMPSTGTLRVGKETFAVMGASWMDREWSTSALERGQAGWDWFALQLGSGEELMFYQLRRRDGTTDTHSGGVWVDAAGATRPIT